MFTYSNLHLYSIVILLKLFLEGRVFTIYLEAYDFSILFISGSEKNNQKKRATITLSHIPFIN